MTSFDIVPDEFTRSTVETQVDASTVPADSRHPVHAQLHELKSRQAQLELENTALRLEKIALMKSRDRYSELLLHEMTEKLDQAFFKAAPDYSRFHFISSAVDRIWGRPRSQLMENPRAWLDWLHPEDRLEVVQLMARSLNEQSYFAEFRVIWPDGEVRWIHSHAFSMGRPGEEGYVIGYQRDITESKRIESELITARQAAETASIAKSRFLAAASHDLRQPIQAINLFSDALARTTLSVDQQRICDFLAQSVHSLSDMLNVLLDISKLDAGALKPRPELVLIDELFSRLVAAFSPLAAEKHLRFKVYFPFTEIAISTDISLLMSLFSNLIANAIKYTEQGSVLVSIRRRGDQALFQVWDTGIGIPPEHMNSIFNEYFQIENPTRDRTKGLGLGLAVASRVAKLLGTELVCRSRLNKGSVFAFSLPLSKNLLDRQPVAYAHTVAEAGVATIGAGRKIVMVEDDLGVARAIKISLELLGMSVAIFGTAEEALSTAEIMDADFYISDFRLPGMSGFEFLDALQRRSVKPVKGLVLSGDTTPERIELTRSFNWPVLFKPVQLPSLLSAIEAQDGRLAEKV